MRSLVHIECASSECSSDRKHSIARAFATRAHKEWTKLKAYTTLVNVYVDLVVFTRIAATS